VDYPGEISLKQIYGTFNRAMLKKYTNMKPYADALTNAMVEFFLMTQVRFKITLVLKIDLISLGTIYCRSTTTLCLFATRNDSMGNIK
jgi:nitric oxide reductase large subunit